MTTNNTSNIPTGASGTVLRGGGVGSASAFSTATYPSTAGTSGNLLTSDGTNWNSSALATVTVPQGGTGDTSLTAYAVLCGGTTSTGNVQSIASVGTSGQVLTSNGAGALPTFQTIEGGFIWSEVTGTSQSMAVGNAYILNNAGLVTATLPSSASVGQLVWVVGKGAGGWKVAQNSGQTIHFGSSNTTTGTGGSLASTNQYDAIQLVCTIANTDWTCTGVAQGNLTVV